MEGKHQVLIPKPLKHSSGHGGHGGHGRTDTLQLTAWKLDVLKKAATSAGHETWRIVKAQVLGRLRLSVPRLKGGTAEDFRVEFLHQIEAPAGPEHLRERREGYVLNVTKYLAFGSRAQCMYIYL